MAGDWKSQPVRNKSRWCACASGLHFRLSLLGSRRLAIRKLRQLLTLHHGEARVAPLDLVDEAADALRVRFRVALQLRKTQPLVRVEDYGARKDIRAEELLELSLNCHVHPHPLERRAATVQLRSQLRLKSREHVHVSSRGGTVRQIDYA